MALWAGCLFTRMDRLRRHQGRQLDALGLGPWETPSRAMPIRSTLRLRAYHHHHPDGTDNGPVLLIVPAPIKRAYIWDLVPRVSVVRRCLEHGLRVYLLEWTEPGAAEQDLGLAEYAGRFILDSLDAIAAETGTRRVLLAGHSLGGTLAALFAAQYPDRVRGLALLEAPLRFGRDSGVLPPLVQAAPPASVLRSMFGIIPGSFLNAAGIIAAPSEFVGERWLDWLRSASDPEALSIHLRVERWTRDEMPQPGRLFEEVVEYLYREDRFARGTLTVGGRPATPQGLSMPLLAVVDPRSTIIPPGATLPVLAAAPSVDRRVLRYDGDRGVALQHVGILVGTSAHRTLWPGILDWLRGLGPTGR